MKKTYESPSIKSHGDVRALTQGGPGSGGGVVHIYGCPTRRCGTPTFWGAATSALAVPRVAAARNALTHFADRGIVPFRDTAGRRWALESYAEMATRTAVGRAQVAGTLDRFVDAGRFSAHNVKVVTEANVVFLMGIVTRAEADAVCQEIMDRLLLLRDPASGEPHARAGSPGGGRVAGCFI